MTTTSSPTSTDSEHLAQQIAAAGQALIAAPGLGAAAAARAAAIMANGDSVTVVTDMTGVSDTYGLLADAGHTGDVRFTSPQTLAKTRQSLQSAAVLAIDIDGLARAARNYPQERADILPAAAAADRVVLFADKASEHVTAVVNQLHHRGARITVIAA